MEGFGWYTYEVVKRLVENHPEHEFVFFFDRPFDPKFVFGKNVEPVVLFPPARHPVLFRWWFNRSITKALKKYKVDVFFSPDGYLSLKTAVPQIPVIHDLNFEHYPEDLPAKHRNYYRSYFPKFAEKAARIITVSNYSKADIVSTYGIESDKITVAWNGASPTFVPLNKEKIETVRAKYTSGRPYFIYVGAIHARKNVGRLVSAFSKFAWKNNQVDLLIVGESIWNTENTLIPEIADEIKQRIIFTGHIPLSELNELMGAALALTYVPYFEGFGIPLVEAMRCGLPILSGNLTCLPEVAEDAAIYVDPFNVDEISDAMLKLSDDEPLRIKLSQQSLKRAELFSWDHTAKAVWNVIVGVANKKLHE
jgi:glycosyltransferase involved in cell wall biosynthesis